MTSSGTGTGDIPIVRKTPDRAVSGPGRYVAPDEIVEYAPQTSAGAVNTADCFISTTSPEAAKNGPRTRVAPTNVPRQLNVQNLADINVYSSVVGEGISVTVRKRS